MKAVILDAATLGEDIDLSPIREEVESLDVHDLTAPEQCAERLRDVEVAIVNKVVLDGELLASLPRLKLICVLATGTNNIDMTAAEQQGIAVKNVTAYGTASVAQHVLMLMLGLANRLPLYRRDVSEGRWNRSPIFCLLDHRTLELAGKRLAIVGSGELGQAVAHLAEAFGMEVIFTARPGSEAQDERPALDELAASIDVLSLHCPLTDETRHLVDEAMLARMKPDALLINCARGAIIDEEAALEALRDGCLGGLGVDVLPEEPPRDGHPLIDALDEPLNLLVTPHNAWITPEARANVVRLTVENLRSFKNS
ncbi:glycerate dehydrogenase [Modicisalibacter ilicicola DSM 19980]|uniref:Glycerate dehydrogenase n=1 Tax=Modicisalibacter ilicicola DSM 19980 TaxID=1121942 RepID=A0A1M4XDE1_9GAMM|nr:D-2-hydroxyacid dehydrogenase [Halomonas ilicicola]SHE91453.1 glycerate dehydrogenase [Halomonas ilicicola DSM 19980]